MKICQSIWAGRRLPTIFELWKICYDSTSCSTVRTTLSLGSNDYWSSTEYSTSIARLLYMGVGLSYDNYNKTNTIYVLCYHD
jgi:hypothetical protein